MFNYKNIILYSIDIVLISVLLLLAACTLMYYRQKSKEMSKIISFKAGSPSNLETTFSSKLWFIYKFHDTTPSPALPILSGANLCSILYQSNASEVSNIYIYIYILHFI